MIKRIIFACLLVFVGVGIFVSTSRVDAQVVAGVCSSVGYQCQSGTYRGTGYQNGDPIGATPGSYFYWGCAASNGAITNCSAPVVVPTSTPAPTPTTTTALPPGATTIPGTTVLQFSPVSGCSSSSQCASVAEWLQQGLQDLETTASEYSAADVAGEAEVLFGYGCNGQPCTSPAEAAQALYPAAALYCTESTTGSNFSGYTAEPGCADNGVSAVGAIYQTYLSFLDSLPAAIWTTGATNLASGAYGGLQCPAGTTGPMANGLCLASGASVATVAPVNPATMPAYNTSGSSGGSSGGSTTQNNTSPSSVSTLNSSLSGSLSGFSQILSSINAAAQGNGVTTTAESSSGGSTSSSGSGSTSAGGGVCASAAASTISNSLQTLQGLATVLSGGNVSAGVLTSVQNLINAVAQVISALAGCVTSPTSSGSTGSSPSAPVVTSPTPVVPVAPVESSQTSPVITSLLPSSGPVGTQVTITGTGFTSTKNTIQFSVYSFLNVTATNNGTNLVFAVPGAIYENNCPVGSACPNDARVATPGNYDVSVTNANGTSSDAVFTITSAN